MKKSIILLVVLAVSGDMSAEMVCLANWSNDYNIAILSASGKWVQLKPRERTLFKEIDIDLTKNLTLQACDKGNNKCRFSTSDFSKNSISYPIAKVNVNREQSASKDGIVLVLDAGTSMFNGLNVAEQDKKANNKTVRVKALSQEDTNKVIIFTQDDLDQMTIDVSRIKTLNDDQMLRLFQLNPSNVDSLEIDGIENRYNALKKKYEPTNFSGSKKIDANTAINRIEETWEKIKAMNEAQKNMPARRTPRQDSL